MGMKRKKQTFAVIADILEKKTYKQKTKVTLDVMILTKVFKAENSMTCFSYHYCLWNEKKYLDSFRLL